MTGYAGTGSGMELLGLIVLSITTTLICVSIIHRWRMRQRLALRRRLLLAAAQERTDLQRGLHPPGEPLPEEVKDALPLSTFKAEDSISDERTCPICLMDYEEREELLTLPCKHSFHKECLGAWFVSHSTCPICRLSLLNDSQELSVRIHEGAAAGATSNGVSSSASGHQPGRQEDHLHPDDIPRQVHLTVADSNRGEGTSGPAQDNPEPIYTQPQYRTHLSSVVHVSESVEERDTLVVTRISA